MLSKFFEGAPSGISIDGFEIFFEDGYCLILVSFYCKNASFYWIFSKIYGFESPFIKIDGFGQIRRTYANGAPV